MDISVMHLNVGAQMMIHLNPVLKMSSCNEDSLPVLFLCSSNKEVIVIGLSHRSVNLLEALKKFIFFF